MITVARGAAHPASVLDDLGRAVSLTCAPTRIVSLVPSVTELLFALGGGAWVVGATSFCVEPAAARCVTRVGGPKTPDIAAIRGLHPDIVLASVEENRKEDVDALTAVGVPVYVAFPRTVEAGICLVRTVGVLLGREEEAAALARRLEAARAAVVADAALGPRPRVFCPIWKGPWMTFNGDTFAHDMLATAGGENVFAALTEHYPVVDAAMVVSRRPEVILLPSEPYLFGRRDLPDLRQLLGATAGPRARVRFIDGRALTWYGARIDWGLRLLRVQLGSRGTEREAEEVVW